MSIYKKISIALSVSLIVGGSVANAQNPNQDPSVNLNSVTDANAVNTTWQPSVAKDGIIDAAPHINKSLEMPNIRENDAAFKRRVWRLIDVRQKQNQAFVYTGDEYTGGGAFIEILIDAVRKGKATAYSVLDDRFTTPLTMEAFESSMGGTKDTVDVENLETGEIIRKVIDRAFNVNTVTKYRIKEDWVFDRNVGRMVVRIVAIAPLKDVTNENTGEYMYSAPLFWLNYEQLRSVLVNYEVYNPQNDLHRMTWTDFFDSRRFASVVIKTSANNPTGTTFERSLRGLQDGENAIEGIREMEDNMWSH
jgi:gliding motility associated protien GldN